MGYIMPVQYRPQPTVLFFTALVSVIPLAYYIGMAVSSISAQTSFAIGAILNATFGSVVELILYFTTIALGGEKLDGLVQYSITGSLLSTMLLLPGLSMVFGGLKYKEQKFNLLAAGVSSVLLFISVIGTSIISYISSETLIKCNRYSMKSRISA
jgi:Ca2+:H+ antiporter